MSEKKLDIYFEFNNTNINLAAFNKNNDKLEYYKEFPYLSYFNNYNELNFEKLDKLLEDCIFEIEKSTKEFLKDVYLIVETAESTSIQISVRNFHFVHISHILYLLLFFIKLPIKMIHIINIEYFQIWLEFLSFGLHLLPVQKLVRKTIHVSMIG